MATTPVRSTSEAELNAWNQAMRASRVYQTFLKRYGLVDLGRGVKMSRAQQSALEDTLRASGVQIPSGMHIDQGGNLNQTNRLGRNLAIAAGATAAAFGIPAIAGMGGAGLSASAAPSAFAGVQGSTIGSILGGTGAAGAGASTAGSIIGGGGAAKAGLSLTDWITNLAGPVSGVVGGIYGINKQTSAADRAAQLQIDAANRAADLQAKAAADALAYQKAVDERNYQLALENQRYGREQTAQKVARMQPFVDFGTASIGQLAQPIYRPGQAGSIQSILAGGR